MATSKIDFANASEIFTLKKQGAPVPKNVIDAARRTLAGAGTAADRDVIKNYIGIKRSGKGKWKRAVSQIQGIQADVGKVEIAAEMVTTAAATGQNPIPAGIRLVNVLQDRFQDFLKTKLVKNVAVSVGKYIGSDAQTSKALLLSMRRAAGLSQGVLAAIGLGVDIGSRIGLGLFDANASRQKSAGKAFEEAYAGRMNIANFAAQAKAVRAQAQAGRGPLERIMDSLGFDESKTAAENQAIETRSHNIQRARATQAIRDPHEYTKALNLFAQKRGKLVSELTERELNEVADAEVGDELSGEKNITFGDSDKTTAMGAKVYTKIALKNAAYKAWFATLNWSQANAELRQIYETEVVPENQTGKERRIEDYRRAAENKRMELVDTPQKAYQFRQKIAIAQADFQAEYARHKAIEWD